MLRAHTLSIGKESLRPSVIRTAAGLDNCGPIVAQYLAFNLLLLLLLLGVGITTHYGLDGPGIEFL